MRAFFPYLAQAIAAVVAITIHEFTKALVSTALNDKTPGEKGRLTLNPLKHLEFFGFFTMWFFGLGWGKPVETTPMYYKDRRMGTLLTNFTPIIVNIFFGFLFAYILRLFANSYEALTMLHRIAFYNFTLALFNLIPVYPLSGAKILGLFLSPNAALSMSRYEKIFQIILLVAIFLGFLSSIINPAANFLLVLAL